jgi:DNA-binding NtrC family response regulator
MGSPSTIAIPKRVEVLLVSSSQDEYRSLANIVETRSRWCVHSVQTCQQAVEYLKNHPLGVVIADEQLPDGDWKQLLGETARLPYRPNLIVSSRKSDERLWGEVLNLGAYDMLLMPFDPDEVFEVGTVAWQSWWNRIEMALRRKPAVRASHVSGSAATADRAAAASA